MNITIKDIARETGLSTATISKYLNNKKILPENRILIENTIHRLDYRPNRTAQRLRSQKTRTIGIFLSNLGNYFWNPLVNSVISFFFKYHYTVITCGYYFNAQKEADYIKDLIAQNPDGIIMLPNDSADELYTVFQDAGIPVVLIDQIPEMLAAHPVDCVITDNRKGSAMLAQHLLDMGHRNIYILEHSTHSYSLDQRIKGFTDVLVQNGFDPEAFQNNLPPIPFTISENVVTQAKQRFRQVMCSPNPPTAIFFTNYVMAMGGLKAANSGRYDIPNEISLVCFDDDPLFSAMRVPMTCASQDLAGMGRIASELLMRRISGDFSDFPKVGVSSVEFHPRQSVKDLRKSD